MNWLDRSSASGDFTDVSIQRRTLSLLSCAALGLLSACEPSGSSSAGDTDTQETGSSSQSSGQVTDTEDKSGKASAGKNKSKSSPQTPSDSESEDPKSSEVESSKPKKKEQKKPDEKEKGEVFPGVVPETVDAGGFPELRSKVERDLNPSASFQDMRHLSNANNDLGFDLIRSLAQESDKSLAVSPVSIHSAMGLLLSAANDETQTELISGNGFLPDVEQTHAAISRLSMQLASLQEEKTESVDPVILRMANRIFIRPNGSPRSDYLDVLGKYYDTGAYKVDFEGNPEQARVQINDWVTKRTESRIKNLLPEGSIIPLTQWVFVNALYFKAPWSKGGFRERNTKNKPFQLLDGKEVSVPMMRGSHEHAYRGESKNYDWAAMSLGRQGRLVAAFIKPKTGKFDEVQSKLSSEQIKEDFSNAHRCLLTISLPKFKVETGSKSLIPFYRERGVHRIFGSDGPAQLDGIGLSKNSKLGVLVHSVFFAVDEQGVEAAAATAGGVQDESAEEPQRCESLELDEPFMFMVYDTRSKLVLFAGRMMDPSQAQ